VPLRGRLGAFVRPLLGQRVPRQPRVPLTHCGPPLTDEELIKMYSRSRISLGFSSVADSSGIKQVRLRDFEAPMSGAFYMVEEFDELAEFFEPGKEIVFFTTPEDLLEKARYYLRHEAQRRRIRAAGLRRARAEHTWQDRFRMVFREMGLS
jgi:spore maturation protein CgeB